MAAYFVHGPGPLYILFQNIKALTICLGLQYLKVNIIFFLLLKKIPPSHHNTLCFFQRAKDEKLQMSATFIRLDIQQMTMPNNNGYQHT